MVCPQYQISPNTLKLHHHPEPYTRILRYTSVFETITFRVVTHLQSQKFATLQCYLYLLRYNETFPVFCHYLGHVVNHRRGALCQFLNVFIFQVVVQPMMPTRVNSDRAMCEATVLISRHVLLVISTCRQSPVFLVELRPKPSSTIVGLR